MSTGSWDDSSTLVKDVPSPPLSGDDVFRKAHSAAEPATASQAFQDKAEDSLPTGARHTSAFSSPKLGLFSKKAKAAKGLSFLIKASKEGAKRKVKSPSKSPSKEGFVQEFGDAQPVEEQVKAKSEQWQAFLQMQDRIKLNVLKTQQNIGKLAAGRISPSGRISPAKRDQLTNDEEAEGDEEDPSTVTPWTDQSAEGAQARGSQAAATEEDTAGFSDVNEKAQTEDRDDSGVEQLITGLRDLPHFHLTPAGSSSNRPAANSSDMMAEEQNSFMDLLSGAKPVPPSTPVEPNAEEVDLLGLGLEPMSVDGGQQPAPLPINEDLLGLEDFLSQPAPNVEVRAADSNDWWMSSSTAFSSTQSSLCSSPVAIDVEFLAEQGFFAADSTAVSDLARTLVDDFLQWGAADKESGGSESLSTNPFASDIGHSVAATAKADTSNPFSATADFSTGDLLDGFGESSKPATDSSKDLDPFSAVLSTTTSSSQCTATILDPFGVSQASTSAPLSLDFNGNSHEKEESHLPAFCSETTKIAQKPQPANPFLTEPVSQSASQQQSDFDDDFFSSKAPASGQQNADDVWGTVDPGTPSQSFNPFENDLFTAPSAPFDASADPGRGEQDTLRLVNPFLTASCENLAAAPIPSANVHQLFVASTDELNTVGITEPAPVDTTQPADPFDPFSSAPSEAAMPDVLMNDDAKRDEEQAASALDDEDKDLNEDEEDTGIKLHIRPEALHTASAGSGPVPLLPPPPKRPKSPPTSNRENPFDKASPPEENFADFPVVEDKEDKVTDHVEPRGKLKSASSESSSYEEDESLEPLEPFRPSCNKNCWKLLLRLPVKKKLGGHRHWKTVYAKTVSTKDGPVLKVYESEDCEGDVLQELPLQPCYSLSELTVQQFDQYGKIHTVKVQYVFYRERVGIKPERITPSFVRKPKPTMVLDHAPQVSELLKFGSLDLEEIRSFVWEVEDAFMNMDVRRDKTLTYSKDEIQAEVWDEYVAVIDKDGHTLNQKARVRVFVLAFLTGMPACELGINDRSREGKEVVGRHDIIPVKTEDWIRIEDPQFHGVVELDTFEKTSNIRFRPLDACHFELLRFRVRPRENRELPLQLRVQQIMKDRHYEIRCDMMVTGYHAFSKKCGQFPCEDIEVRFKVPESWIYYFRYERKFR